MGPVLAMTACADRESAPIPAASVHGSWQVVAFEQPGVTALSASEAESWIGFPAHFSDSLAVFGDDRCETPSFRSGPTTGDRFVQDYQIVPSTLGLGDTITTTRVLCSEDWISPAATLYHRGSDLLAVWDGTFFVLRRR